MAGFSQEGLKKQTLSSTKYKGLRVVDAVQKDRPFFEKLRVSGDFNKLKDLEKTAILRALNLSYDSIRYKENPLVKEIINILQLGKTRDFIVNIWAREKGISSTLASTYIAHALSIIEQDMEVRKSETISLHTIRYEEIYEKNASINLDDLPEELPEPTKRAIVSDNYYVALEALQSKERLLGMHTRNYKVQLNSYLEKIYKPQAKNTDFKILSFEELIFLRQSIQKMKGLELTDDIVPTNHKGVQDVSYEVVKQENPLDKVIEANQIIQVKVKDKSQVKKGKALHEVHQEIQQNAIKKQILNEKLKKMLNKK
jgi:hypothetical protein